MFTKPPFTPLFIGIALIALAPLIIAIPPSPDDDFLPAPQTDQSLSTAIEPGYVPPRGFVPDSVTAVRIAVAVWIPIYGRNLISSEQPFVAKLEGDVWTVTGSLPKRWNQGGTAEARISKKDGRILFVIHSQ